jgi:ubiquinone/menaquinone biosynthesis C-methylase UbiE
MALSDSFARQLARPHGWAGRMLGGAMDFANRKPMRLALEYLLPRNGEALLDVGCGTGMALKSVAGQARCTLYGVDPSRTMLIAAASRLRSDAVLVEGELGALPFPDEAFDAALALNMLYFCDGEGAMLADLHRVLRPGGRLVAYVTHRNSMENWAFVRAGHHRLYDEGELRHALVQGGFAFDTIVIHEANVGPSVRGLFAIAWR